MLLLSLLGFANSLTSASTRVTPQAATTVESMLFQNFKAAGIWGGGAVMAERWTTDPEQTITVVSCEFIDNQNGYGGDSQGCNQLKGGGAIFVEKFVLRCEECLFEKCKAVSGRGGAIQARWKSKATILTCNFSECNTLSKYCSDVTLGGGGGAVCVDELFLTISGCNFTKCMCGTKEWDSNGGFPGGAILAKGGIACRQCQFEDVGSDEVFVSEGGAIWISGTDDPSSVTECDFTNARAAHFGALRYSGRGKFELSQCSFDECNGALGILCMHINTTELVFSSIELSFGANPRPVVELVEFDDGEMDIEILNFRIIGSGGIFTEANDQCILLPRSQKISFRDSVFENFGKNANGGGAFRFEASGKTVEFINCSFKSISARNRGGAITFVEGSTDICYINDTVFESCRADEHGGAVFGGMNGDGAALYVNNCTFIGNTVQDAYGQSLHIHFSQESFSRSLIRNCTFKSHTKGFPMLMKIGDSQTFSNL